jgi:hypothetical protein
MRIVAAVDSGAPLGSLLWRCYTATVLLCRIEHGIDDVDSSVHVHSQFFLPGLTLRAAGTQSLGAHTR